MSELRLVQLGFNQFSGEIPSSMTHLQKLEVLELNSNKFTGSIPILGSQLLVGLDVSDNELSGDFPGAYFTSDSYIHLDYINVNFNNLLVPQHCIRYSFCFKRKLVGNLATCVVQAC